MRCWGLSQFLTPILRKAAAAGIQVARVLEALGIWQRIMKPKTKLVPGAESVDLVAAGEAEFALGTDLSALLTEQIAHFVHF